MAYAELVVIGVPVLGLTISVVYLSFRLVASNQIVCGLAKTFAEHALSNDQSVREMRRLKLETDREEILLREMRERNTVKAKPDGDIPHNGYEPTDYVASTGIVDN